MSPEARVYRRRVAFLDRHGWWLAFLPSIALGLLYVAYSLDSSWLGFAPALFSFTWMLMSGVIAGLGTVWATRAEERQVAMPVAIARTRRRRAELA